jgi:hypothetical protein
LIRLYFCLLAGLAIAVGVILLANVVVGNPLTASLAGDATFVLTLGILIWRNPALPLTSAGSVLAAVVAFIATGIFLADLGGATYFTIPPLGQVLVHVFSIGYYPPGADAPFDMGAMLWALSMLALCAAGLVAGGSLRSLGSGDPD